MFSQTAEYALRAAVFLAGRPEGLFSSQVIAETTKVPAGYLSKVLQDLVEAGIVRSQRGPNGGFALDRPAAGISVLEVINAVDPIQRIHSCPLGLKEHATQLCKLHLALDGAIATIESALQSSTLADMLNPATPGKPVFPTVKGALLRAGAAVPSASRRRARSRT
jgi:Rrf2 family transcriptional regulator, nitric oxide-sensitive transcriptional repressor